MDRLTIPEYEMMLKAERLKQTDINFRVHEQAWLNFAAQAEKKSGKKRKPAYPNFKKFYDYEKEIENAMNDGEQKSEFAGLYEFLRKGE